MLRPIELQEMYSKGKNITELLREEKGLKNNTDEIIETAYDLQAGGYISSMEKEMMRTYKHEYTSKLAGTILSLCPNPTSILEAGVGEATTLSGVLDKLPTSIKSYGFDISWSRVAFARNWLKEHNFADVTLCTGNLFNIPFLDNSVDIVYTSHSIEPNGGSEEPILRELYRVTKKYLILLEPGYDLAGDEVKKRMDDHGYCKNLKGTAEEIGCNVIDYDLFNVSINPLNPTSIIVIKKGNNGGKMPNVLACPNFKTPLEELGGMLFSPEALVVYPIIGGIPCLRIENGILASKYKEIIMSAK